MTGGINRVWAQLIIAELVRSGVDTFCLASGYRNAPLSMAAVEHPRAKVVTHYDERGAAFFALGFARASGRAAGWITTSGTAVANGLPAIVEADADRVPMVLLTADRPPELRQAGANQAIDQPAMFHRYVRWSFDLPAPSEDVPPAFVLTTVDQACFRARSVPEGPVHINCMFRAPLVCEEAVETGYLTRLQSWQQTQVPYTQYVQAPPDSGVKDIAALLEQVSRVLLVIGRLKKHEDGAAALDLATARRWPVFADINSQVRLGCVSDVLIDAFELCLEDETFADRHAPEAVLFLGAPAVSKKVMQFLARHRPYPFVVVDEGPCRFDPTHQVSHRVQCGAGAASSEIKSRLAFAHGFEEDWLHAWQDANSRVRQVLAAQLAGAGSLSEPFVARAVTMLIPAGHGMVIGNSMPVRDADRFGAVLGARAPVIANRGASGIDGTIATAAGAAHGWAVPVTVIVGDLAFLHDINSLAMVRRLPLTIVVINNDGGGIFHRVEIDSAPDTFERCFGTPHGLQFEHAARLFGIRYAHVSSREAFMAVYSGSCGDGEATIIEVRTDRRENHELHEALQAQAAAAIAAIKPDT